MAEKLEDLNLPNTIVTRLIKDALPDNVNVSKEARMAVAKAASVFVLYLTNSSNQVAISSNRKTINANDVLQGLKETDFTDFVPPLQEALEGFKKSQREKKDASAKKKKDKDDKPEEMEVEENAAENSDAET